MFLPQELATGAYYLTGATAVGKTSVGVALARRIGAEVVALDSMTLYRGMDVGTAKPTQAERGGVPHHLMDVLDPWEASNVADYRARALGVLEDLRTRGRRALFVGGTGLYLKAMLRGLFVGPAADLAARERWEAEADRLGVEVLHRRLAEWDPLAATRLHPNDRRRVIRALEVCEATGGTLSALQAEHDRVAEGVSVIALVRAREDLRRRIDLRVGRMFAEGLVEEVRGLQAGARPIGPTALQGVGYRETVELLEGRLSRPEVVERVQLKTRQFAKRQGTWFRGLAEVREWPVGEDEDPERTAEALAGVFVGGAVGD